MYGDSWLIENCFSQAIHKILETFADTPSPFLSSPCKFEPSPFLANIQRLEDSVHARYGTQSTKLNGFQ